MQRRSVAGWHGRKILGSYGQFASEESAFRQHQRQRATLFPPFYRLMRSSPQQCSRSNARTRPNRVKGRSRPRSFRVSSFDPESPERSRSGKLFQDHRYVSCAPAVRPKSPLPKHCLIVCERGPAGRWPHALFRGWHTVDARIRRLTPHRNARTIVSSY